MSDAANEAPRQLHQSSAIKGPAADRDGIAERNATLSVVVTVDADTVPTATDDRELSGDPRPPALDAGVLDDLEYLADGGNLIGELAEMFIADAVVQLSRLDGALARGDGRTLSQVAHRLKGSSANLGAMELARLCSALPASTDSLDLPGAELVVLAIRSELERVRSAFDERIGH